MKLYHGSNIAIEAIDLSCSKPNKDFGQAFYLSADIAQAQEMAKAKCIQFGGTPCVTTFEVDEEQMQHLHTRNSTLITTNGRDSFTTIVTSSKTLHTSTTSFMVQ